VLVPQLVQMPTASGYGLGRTATEAGLYLLPSAVVMLLAAPLAGRMDARMGSKPPMLLGAALVAAGFGGLILAHSAAWHVVLSCAVMGFGVGLTFAAMINLIMAAVPPEQTGVATGVNNVVRNIGGSFGAQLLSAILTAHLTVAGFPSERGFVLASGLAAAMAVVALAVSAGIPGRRSQVMAPGTA
jgi:MFS family permease